MIYRNVSELIGHTPLYEPVNYAKKHRLKARLLVKLEYFNPGGSAKDRVAAEMIADAEAKGILNKKSTIIEPTSGNTGIGLAALCASKGYRLVITMPETMSPERRKLMSAYGAEVILTDGSKGMAGAIEKANELLKEIPGSFIAGQFDNPANPQAHYNTTGPEIWEDTEGNIDIFTATVGTGGTLTGTGRYLKEKNPSTEIYAVEPASSAVLSGKPAGKHKIQGIGAGFVPAVLDTKLYDGVIRVTDDNAYKAAREFAKTEGILVGISSGAALAAAAGLAAKEENRGKTIVTVLPDTGERYLSGDLF